MDQKTKLWIAAGVVGGCAAIGAVALGVWNSKQMRMLRATKRAGKILYRVGGAMQTMSALLE